jgi:antitoxin CptB
MDPRRKRLLFRCNHRGTMENDILLGGFAAIHAKDLTESQMAGLEVLLDESDNDIYNWIIGKEPVPEAHDTDLMTWVRKFNNCL